MRIHSLCFVALSILLSACAGPTAPPPLSSPPPAPNNPPAAPSVAPPHTVTGGAPGAPSGAFDSGNLNPGQNFQYTFKTPGTFAYFCRIHGASMTGVVIVTQ